MDATKHIANSNFYDTYYTHSFDVEGNFAYIDYLLSRLKNIEIKKRSKVLDVGCGVGILGSALLNKFMLEVHGFDISEIAVKKAKKYGLIAKVGLIEKPWGYKNRYFDVVISQQVIEHLINPDYFLEQSKKVLKSNGLLILTTPNLGAWYNRILLLFGFQPFFLEVSTLDKTLGLKFTRKLTSNRHPLGHLRVFTTKALIDILELHNFKIVSVQGGKIFYLPKILQPIDTFFSYFSSLGSDIIIVARKQ